MSEGILSFVEYAPRLRIVLPSRQIRITRLAEILKSKLKILIKSLLKKRDKKYIPLERKRIGLCGRKNPCSERIYLCIEKDVWCASHFFRLQAIFWIIFCLWHIPILGTRMIIWLWMGVENVLCHSHKAIQKQSIKPKGSEYDKVFWSC